MKYVFNILTTVLFARPALVVAYVVSSIVSGYNTGSFLQRTHEDDAIELFCRGKK